jgi:drug/metabolite transporter (DMT)-like permease
MLLSAGVLGALAAVARERLPERRQIGLHLLAGMLLNGCYLCTSWWAIARGMPAGIMALLGALQPLIVAVASLVVFRERLGLGTWAGLVVGLGGVVLVLTPLLAHGRHAPVSPMVTFGSVASVLAMAAGTMIQRGSIGGNPMRVSGAVQNAGGLGVAILATTVLGDYRWSGDLALWLALAWSVLGLSVGGLSLLVWMTRDQGATRVSVLLLMVPPLSALEAWMLFGEQLAPIQIAGFILALGGVLLARWVSGSQAAASKGSGLAT